MKAVFNIITFLTDFEYREKQPWVKWIAKKAAAIAHQDTWTKMRFYSPITLVLDMISCWLSLLAIIFFPLTDLFDGMVARYKGEACGNKGSSLDGWADKVYAYLILFFWGGPFAGYFRYILLAIVEAGGNLLLWLFYENNIIQKPRNTLFEHNIIGKIKMNLEVILILVIWYARHFYPDLPFWPEVIGRSTDLVIFLAVLSIAFKMK